MRVITHDLPLNSSYITILRLFDNENIKYSTNTIYDEESIGLPTIYTEYQTYLFNECEELIAIIEP